MMVRRVYHKPVTPVFDVYLERCGLMGDTNTDAEAEPDFSALVPMQVLLFLFTPPPPPPQRATISFLVTVRVNAWMREYLHFVFMDINVE